MNKCQVRTPEQALLYLADCQLATVSSMAMKKSRGKFEFERQIEIAQTTVDWILNFRLNIDVDSRTYQVLSLPDRKVSTWINKYLQ